MDICDVYTFLFQLLKIGKTDLIQQCFVDLEKAFDRVPRKVLEWAVRKRGGNGESNGDICIMVQRQESEFG